ncbi:MAG: thioredoxin family protein [Bacteroidota bacterium]
MKLKYALIVLFTMYYTGIAIAEDTKGIQFRHITLEEAVAAAKKEHKYVFVHGFADWCSHCKTMAETVYTDSLLGKFYNENYVCLKIDMEKEGKELAKKMRINSYPALIYFDENGGVVHRAKGERKIPEMAEMGRDAKDPKKNMRYYENTFNAGTATIQESYIYLRLLGMAGVDNQYKLNSFLSKQPLDQLTTPEYWRFISDFLTDPTLAIAQTFMDNKKAFEAKFTADSVNSKITGMYISDMMKKIQKLDTMAYEQQKMGLMHSKLDIAEKICAYADLTTFRIKAQWPQYIAAAPAFIEKYCATDAKKLNEAAQQYAERASDPKDIANAEKWAKKSVELMDIYKYNMTLTSVLVKAGKKEDALATAKHALELGKKANIDTKQVMLVIEKMETP